jgi:hypothetical protein
MPSLKTAIACLEIIVRQLFGMKIIGQAVVDG